MDTEALEKSLSWLNFALNFSIGAVVLGLVLEYAPLFWKKLHRWKWIEYCGAILVILGVAGELFLHVRSEQIDDKIKSAQRAAIAQLFDRATAAEKSASQINERAALAEKEAADAKLELAKMNADRSLTPAQTSQFLALLRPYAGSTFWVMVEKGKEDVDSEQEVFGKQLTELFLSAGWLKEIHWSALDPLKEDREFVEVSNRGCEVDFAADYKSTLLGNLVLNQLKQDGIPCRQFIGAEIKRDHVIITICLQ